MLALTASLNGWRRVSACRLGVIEELKKEEKRGRKLRAKNFASVRLVGARTKNGGLALLERRGRGARCSVICAGSSR